jgi:hypothetical protein
MQTQSVHPFGPILFPKAAAVSGLLTISKISILPIYLPLFILYRVCMEVIAGDS